MCVDICFSIGNLVGFESSGGGGGMYAFVGKLQISISTSWI